MELFELTIHELHEKLKAKEVSSVEVTRAMLTRIEAVEPKIGSFITVTADRALSDAAEADRRIAAGEMELLTGIPLALKDIFLTEGIKTTCGSRILHNFVPPYSATAYEKLKQQGVVLLGKLNQDEFAMGSSNESSAYGSVRNPWDTSRIPGDPPAALPRPLPHARPSPPLARIPAVPSVSPPRTAAVLD